MSQKTQTKDMSQTIRVNDYFRIGADSHNIIVYLRRDGTKHWKPVAFFTNLWSAAKFIVDCHIKWEITRLVPEEFLPAISDLMTEIEKIHTDLEPLKALSPRRIAFEGGISALAVRRDITNERHPLAAE